MEIQWKRNEFQTFYAKMNIRLGGDRANYTINKGDEFEFDGTICKYAGMEFAQTGIRGAIKAGWATLDQNDSSSVINVRPQRDMASAVSVNRDLNNVQRHSRGPSVESLDEDTVLEIGDRETAMKNGRGLTAQDNRRTASQVRPANIKTSLDDQEGVVISRLKTSTHAVVDVAANPNYARQLETASYDDGFGRAEIIEGVSMRTNVGSMTGAVVQSDIDGSEGVTVARVRNSQVKSADGIEVRDTSGIRNPPRKASSPKKVEVPTATSGNSKLDIAKSVYKSFPEDWNFFARLDDKLERVEKMGATKGLVQALMKSDSKPLQKALKEKYPKFAV